MCWAPVVELRCTCTYERNVMSAEPPDSRGIGWVWKCLNMSDTVWNHKWWTWHCPFSFTDKRKCWKEEEGKQKKKKQFIVSEERVLHLWNTWKGGGKRKPSETSETHRPRQRSGHYLSGVSLWEQSDRMPRLTPEEEVAAGTSSTLLAGCDVQGSCYTREHSVDITAAFPGTEQVGELWGVAPSFRGTMLNSFVSSIN